MPLPQYSISFLGCYTTYAKGGIELDRCVQQAIELGAKPEEIKIEVKEIS